MSFPNPIKILFSKENQSRGVERIKRAGLTGTSSVIAQGITIIAGFISVPLTIRYLGKEQYGVWLTINSLLQWLYVSNLGLSGNALINKLSDANGKDDKRLAQELVSTAFWTLGGLSIIFLLLFAISSPFINWQWVFNTTDVSAIELKWAMIFAFVCFVMMFPISMVDAIYQSYQEGYIGNIWNIAGSVFSLIALIIVTQMQGGLPLLVASLFGVRLLFSLFNSGYLFFVRHIDLKPYFYSFSHEHFKQLIKLGSTYFIAQLASMGVTQTQPIIITQILGPSFLGSFNVAQRIMFLPATFIQMFIFPLMPAYGEAKARKDWKWVYKTLKYSLLLTFLATLVTFILLVIFAQPIINLWVGQELMPSKSVIYGLGIYMFMGNIATPISVMLYGLEETKGQAIISVVNSIVFVTLAIILTNLYGELGLVLSMIISIMFTNLTGQIIHLNIVMKKEPIKK